jgi:aspartyl/glutamyl-tRNA(Asn/Gln) amidotransferase C subunit
MSGMTEAQIRKLARLARLALTDAEVRALAPELAGIVRHVDALASVDVGGVLPMTHGAPLPTSGSDDGDDRDDDEGMRPPRAAAAGGTGTAILGRSALSGSAAVEDDGSVRVPRVVD